MAWIRSMSFIMSVSSLAFVLLSATLSHASHGDDMSVIPWDCDDPATCVNGYDDPPSFVKVSPLHTFAPLPTFSTRAAGVSAGTGNPGCLIRLKPRMNMVGYAGEGLIGLG